MPNRLASATSPYLLQHKDNPVDWYDWGPEAFDEARRLDVPVILSVGYSACHWCHVMAHESFEDQATAQQMNASFVNIKVDREERPDVDRIYMDAVQAISGHGGWPMTVFLTPDGEPFFAGTYFPKEPRGNMPAFRSVMEAITDAWRGRRQEVEEQARRLTQVVQNHLEPAAAAPGEEAVDAGYAKVAESFDPDYGGFGGAPKFPQAPTLELLLRTAGAPFAPDSRQMLETTLRAMAAGGIYDHLGGGFARYSVDRHWLIPHFEKMLYDNALLARTYLRGWQISGDAEFRRVATETINYMLTDLRLDGGGFASAEDADSEGEEGKFYVWEEAEFAEAAGTDAAEAAEYFGITPAGNFEGVNVLHHDPGKPATDGVNRARLALTERRRDRVRPGLDDKVVAAWNGLAVRTLAEAGATLDEPSYLEAARSTARFVISNMSRGRLMRSWRNGEVSVPAFCEDYAAMAVGLYSLFQATGELEWYEEGRKLLWRMVDLFSDPEGGFFTTGSDTEALIARPKELMDNPTPSANALAAEALFIEAALTGEDRPFDLMEGTFRAGGQLMQAFPTAAGHLLAVRHSTANGGRQVVVVGPKADPNSQALLQAAWADYHHDAVIVHHSGEGESPLPIFAGRVPGPAQPTAYVCRHFVCESPTTDPTVLRNQLEAIT